MVGYLLLILLTVYMFFYMRSMLRFFHVLPEGRTLSLVSGLLAFLIVFVFRAFWNLGNLAIVHLVFISLAFSLLARLVQVLFKPGEDSLFFRVYASRLVPVLLTAVIMVYGIWNMNHVIRTEYRLKSSKLSRNYKIALIADTHYGTIQDGRLLKDKIEEINAQKPDLVILAGDIVEEGTSKEKMHEVFQVLGGLESTYGTYFVFGNHDPQNYSDKPSYTKKDLLGTIEDQGITVLRDKAVELGQDLVLAGRKDAGWNNSDRRLTSDRLLARVDKNRYVIVADHQPLEAEENAAQGADLQLSGHTHAGQIFPIGVINTLRGDLNYGEFHFDDLTAIVTSGFTGWGFSFRTQAHCEYVMVNLMAR